MSDPFAKTVTATVMGVELVLWIREAWDRRDDLRAILAALDLDAIRFRQGGA